jgi:hypothetical protein
MVENKRGLVSASGIDGILGLWKETGACIFGTVQGEEKGRKKK